MFLFIKKIIVVVLLLLVFVHPVFSQKNISFRSRLAYPNALDSSYGLANIWGYAANGKEYALVGTNMGLSIVDVTSPDTCIPLFKVSAAGSIWREVKTHANYAYVTTEGGGGVTIVDLSNLPFSIKDTIWKGNGIAANQVDRIHALHIEDGFMYLYGGSYKNGGMIIADLTNPWNPNYVGEFETYYIHDGCVRGNIAYPGNIGMGFFSVVDISNKSSPVLIATQNTPNNYTHHTWLSDDSKTLFTVDEKPDSYVTAYDVSDFSDIKEISRYRHISDSGAIPHNVYVLNDFVITSYYTEGVTIVDAHKTDNLVEVGHYDTSPFSGNVFNGAWGVYPFLPSGNFLISDIEQGLFVLTPKFVRACYLEGKVTDSLWGYSLGNITAEILNTPVTAITGFGGKYKIGTMDSGTYSIRFSGMGYTPKVIDGVKLKNGETTILNVQFWEGIEKLDFKPYISPNPFSAETKIIYVLNNSSSSSVSIRIYNVLGEKLKDILTDEKQNFGKHEIPLDLKNLHPGIYFLSISSDNQIMGTIKAVKY